MIGMFRTMAHDAGVLAGTTPGYGSRGSDNVSLIAFVLWHITISNRQLGTGAAGDEPLVTVEDQPAVLAPHRGLEIGRIRRC